jgi:hypothetical protein
MRKMMFNDMCGLTASVIQKTKWKTRRIASKVVRQWAVAEVLVDCLGNPIQRELTLKEFALKACPIKVGETIAVAQSYKDIIECEWLPTEKENEVIRMVIENHPGCANKMFVKPELMARYIKITGVDFEHLQDISDDDCMAEGIMYDPKGAAKYGFRYGEGKSKWYRTPKDAFSSLIDKVSGRGTWDSNPYVYVFTFELID